MKMLRGLRFAGLLMGLSACIPTARACTIAHAEPKLAGESDQAYRARIDALHREQADSWLRKRQADGLQRAELIFIGRDTDWSPPPKRRKVSGRQFVTVPSFAFPAPSYYKPIHWFRGAKTTALFQLRASWTSCGPVGFGDTTTSKPGDLFVFFASRTPISEKTLIDAIAVDTITDPTLLTFVANYRKPAKHRD